jgi:hypothetical protein
LFIYVPKLLLLIMLGLAGMALIVPFVQIEREMVKVEVIRDGDYVTLSAKEGFVQVFLPDDEIYSASNPLDFFPSLIDPSIISSLEIVPSGETALCNVRMAQGKNQAGTVEFCIVLAERVGVPLYVHEDLFSLPGLSLQGAGFQGVSP